MKVKLAIMIALLVCLHLGYLTLMRRLALNMLAGLLALMLRLARMLGLVVCLASLFVLRVFVFFLFSFRVPSLKLKFALMLVMMMVMSWVAG